MIRSTFNLKTNLKLSNFFCLKKFLSKKLFKFNRDFKIWIGTVSLYTIAPRPRSYEFEKYDCITKSHKSKKILATVYNFKNLQKSHRS